MRELLNRWSGWAGLGISILASAIYGVSGVAGIAFWIPMALGAGLLGLYLAWNSSDVIESVTSRKARHGANSFFLGLAALAIASLALAIINNHDISWDLSKGKINTLSDETEKTLRNLGSEVQVYAFFDPNGGQQAQFESLLKRVKKLNPAKFSYEFVNINKKPLLAQQYGVRSYGTSVIVSGAKSQSINSSSEEDLVNALAKLGSSVSKSVYFSTGHGELPLPDAGPAGGSELKKALVSATFEVKEVNLATQGGIPADAATLVVAGPKVDFVGPEVALLKDWLSKGGRLIVALDPRTRLPNITGLVAEAGIAMGNDIVVDPIMRIFGNDPIAPLASTFDAGHPVTKDLKNGQQQLIFPLCQSVAVKDKLPAGVNGSILVTSNPTAWAYRGQGNKLPGKPGPGDMAGPVKLAAASEGPGSVFKAGAAAGKNFRVVVYGTSRLLSNEGIALYNNQDLTVNSARWLADEEKNISIAAKKEESQPLMLDRGRVALMWWTILLLPFGVLGAGLVVVMRRRRAA